MLCFSAGRFPHLLPLLEINSSTIMLNAVEVREAKAAASPGVSCHIFNTK